MNGMEIGLHQSTASGLLPSRAESGISRIDMTYRADETPRLKVAFILTLLPVLGLVAFLAYVMLHGETWKALLYPGVGLAAAGLSAIMITLATMGTILAVCVLTLRESHPAWGKVVLAALCVVPIAGCGLVVFLLRGASGVTLGWIPFLTVPLCYFVAMLNLIFHAARDRAV